MPSLCLCIIYLHFKYVQIVYTVCAWLARIAAKSKLSYCNARECVHDMLSIFGQVKSRSSVLPKSLSCMWADIYQIHMYLHLNLAWGAPVINLKYRHMHDNIVYGRHTYTNASLQSAACSVRSSTQIHIQIQMQMPLSQIRVRKNRFYGSLCVFAVFFCFVTYLRNFTFVFFRKLMTFAQLRAATRSKRKQDADKNIENRDKATANALTLFAQISR